MNAGGRSPLAWVRVVAGGVLALWGAFVTLAFGLMSVSEGNGSALAAGVGFLLAGLLTVVPSGLRRGGVVALLAIGAGVALIGAGWHVSSIDSGPSVVKDADWWLHRVGGAALIALGGAAFGRLPSSDVQRWASLDQPGRQHVTRVWIGLAVLAAAALTLGPPGGIAQTAGIFLVVGVAGYLVMRAQASRDRR